MNDNEIGRQMYERAAEFVNRRFPSGWGGCAVACTQEGQYIFHWLRYIVEQQSTTTIPKSEW